MRSYSLTITDINGLSGEEIDGIFYEKELQKTNQTDLRIEKAIKKESDELMINGKTMIIRLIVGLVKEDVV